MRHASPEGCFVCVIHAWAIMWRGTCFPPGFLAVLKQRVSVSVGSISTHIGVPSSHGTGRDVILQSKSDSPNKQQEIFSVQTLRVFDCSYVGTLLIWKSQSTHSIFSSFLVSQCKGGHGEWVMTALLCAFVWQEGAFQKPGCLKKTAIFLTTSLPPLSDCLMRWCLNVHVLKQLQKLFGSLLWLSSCPFGGQVSPPYLGCEQS